MKAACCILLLLLAVPLAYATVGDCDDSSCDNPGYFAGLCAVSDKPCASDFAGQLTPDGIYFPIASDGTCRANTCKLQLSYSGDVGGCFWYAPAATYEFYYGDRIRLPNGQEACLGNTVNGNTIKKLMVLFYDVVGCSNPDYAWFPQTCKPGDAVCVLKKCMDQNGDSHKEWINYTDTASPSGDIDGPLSAAPLEFLTFEVDDGSYDNVDTYHGATMSGHGGDPELYGNPGNDDFLLCSWRRSDWASGTWQADNDCMGFNTTFGNGNYTVSLRMTDGRGNSRTHTHNIAVAPANVDLELTDIWSVPATIKSGEITRIYFKVTNIGTAATPSGAVTVESHVNGTPYSTIPYYGSLDPGSSVNLYMNVSWAPGDYVVLGHAALAFANDTNPGNNDRSETFHVVESRIPDLTVTNIQPNTTNANQNATVFVTVKNIGNGSVDLSGTFQFVELRAYVDGAPALTGGFQRLDAGQDATFNFTNIFSPGTHLVTATVDDSNVVSEANEGNNQYSKSFTFGVTPSGQPDLRAMDITVNPVQADQQATVTVFIKNIGNASLNLSSSQFAELRTTIDGTAARTHYFQQMNAGQSSAFSFTATFPAGNHTVAAVVDAQNIVAEPNEANNQLSRLFTFPGTIYVIDPIVGQSCVSDVDCPGAVCSRFGFCYHPPQMPACQTDADCDSGDCIAGFCGHSTNFVSRPVLSRPQVIADIQGYLRGRDSPFLAYFKYPMDPSKGPFDQEKIIHGRPSSLAETISYEFDYLDAVYNGQYAGKLTLVVPEAKVDSSDGQMKTYDTIVLYGAKLSGDGTVVAADEVVITETKLAPGSVVWRGNDGKLYFRMNFAQARLLEDAHRDGGKVRGMAWAVGEPGFYNVVMDLDPATIKAIRYRIVLDEPNYEYANEIAGLFDAYNSKNNWNEFEAYYKSRNLNPVKNLGNNGGPPEPARPEDVRATFLAYHGKLVRSQLPIVQAETAREALRIRDQELKIRTLQEPAVSLRENTRTAETYLGKAARGAQFYEQVATGAGGQAGRMTPIKGAAAGVVGIVQVLYEFSPVIAQGVFGDKISEQKLKEIMEREGFRETACGAHPFEYNVRFDQLEERVNQQYAYCYPGWTQGNMAGDCSEDRLGVLAGNLYETYGADPNRCRGDWPAQYVRPYGDGKLWTEYLKMPMRNVCTQNIYVDLINFTAQRTITKTIYTNRSACDYYVLNFVVDEPSVLPFPINYPDAPIYAGMAKASVRMQDASLLWFNPLETGVEEFKVKGACDDIPYGPFQMINRNELTNAFCIDNSNWYEAASGVSPLFPKGSFPLFIYPKTTEPFNITLTFSYNSWFGAYRGSCFRYDTAGVECSSLLNEDPGLVSSGTNQTPTVYSNSSSLKTITVPSNGELFRKAAVYLNSSQDVQVDICADGIVEEVVATGEPSIDLANLINSCNLCNSSQVQIILSSNGSFDVLATVFEQAHQDVPALLAGLHDVWLRPGETRTLSLNVTPGDANVSTSGSCFANLTCTPAPNLTGIHEITVTARKGTSIDIESFDLVVSANSAAVQKSNSTQPAAFAVVVRNGSARVDYGVALPVQRVTVFPVLKNHSGRMLLEVFNLLDNSSAGQNYTAVSVNFTNLRPGYYEVFVLNVTNSSQHPAELDEAVIAHQANFTMESDLYLDVPAQVAVVKGDLAHIYAYSKPGATPGFGAPFNSEGDYLTPQNVTGTMVVNVTASEGSATLTKTVKVILLNGTAGQQAATYSLPKNYSNYTINWVTTWANSQCFSDSDCIVGGCSGTYCTPISAPQFVTTCEWNDWYACYGLSSCGCNGGYCSWSQNPGFVQCLANYSAPGRGRGGTPGTPTIPTTIRVLCGNNTIASGNYGSVAFLLNSSNNCSAPKLTVISNGSCADYACLNITVVADGQQINATRLELKGPVPNFTAPAAINASAGERVCINYSAEPNASMEFEPPFGEDGCWQTNGSAYGIYNTRVTAFNSYAQRTKLVVVSVNAANGSAPAVLQTLSSSGSAPNLSIAANISGTEGVLIRLSQMVSNSGGNAFFTYSPPFDANGDWTPTFDSAGGYLVTVCASNIFGEDCKSSWLTVANVNRPPILRIQNFAVVENETARAPYFAYDPDGGSVTLSFASPLNASGKWKTGFSDSGVYNLTAAASDGVLNTSALFILTVLDRNRLPMLQVPMNITGREGEGLLLVANASDPDGEPVNVTYTSPLNLNGAWTPGFEEAGEYSGYACASDGTGKSCEPFQITVLNVNRAPSLGLPAEMNASEGEEILLNPAVFDPDGDAVAVLYPPPFDSNGSWLTGYHDAGNHTFSICASDDANETCRDVNITVFNVNRAPVLSVANITAKEGDLVMASANVTDQEGDAVSAWYSNLFDSNGTWQTDFDDAGSYNVTVFASDGLETANATFNVGIANLNRPPQVGLLASITVNENETVTLSPVVSDPDGDNTTISFAPPFDANGSWTPGYDDSGTHVAHAYASDGLFEAEANVTIIVDNVNRPPAVAIENRTIYEGETYLPAYSANDPDGDNVSIGFPAPLAPDGWFTPGYNQHGTYNLIANASDGAEVVPVPFTVEVLDVNAPPVLSVAPLFTLEREVTFCITANATDPDWDDVALSYSPPLNESGCWTPQNYSGEQGVVVTASDGVLNSTAQSMLLVNGTEHSPVLEDLQDFDAYEGELVAISPAYYDPDGDNLTLIFYAPLDSEGGWQTQSGDAGVRTLRYCASDGTELTCHETTVTVKGPGINPPRPPRPRPPAGRDLN